MQWSSYKFQSIRTRASLLNGCLSKRFLLVIAISALQIPLRAFPNKVYVNLIRPFFFSVAGSNDTLIRLISHSLGTVCKKILSSFLRNPKTLIHLK